MVAYQAAVVVVVMSWVAVETCLVFVAATLVSVVVAYQAAVVADTVMLGAYQVLVVVDIAMLEVVAGEVVLVAADHQVAAFAETDKVNHPTKHIYPLPMNWLLKNKINKLTQAP